MFPGEMTHTITESRHVSIHLTHALHNLLITQTVPFDHYESGCSMKRYKLKTPILRSEDVIGKYMSELMSAITKVHQLGGSGLYRVSFINVQ